MLGVFGIEKEFVFKALRSEVDEHTIWIVKNHGVVLGLGQMDIFYSDQSLDFDHNPSLDDKISPSITNMLSIIEDRMAQFPFIANSSFVKLQGQSPLIDHLLKPWSQISMNSHSTADDLVSQWIKIHVRECWTKTKYDNKSRKKQSIQARRFQIPIEQKQNCPKDEPMGNSAILIILKF